MNRRDIFLPLPLAAAALLLRPSALHAQDAAYPSKPIRFIVPFAAGGALDILARLLGERLTEQMKQTIVVENKPGANGNLAMDFVAKIAPDGYTMMIGSNGLATNKSLYKKLAFDVQRDLAPVIYVGYAPLICVVPATSPYTSLRELVAAAKAAPGKLSFASAGAGSSGHLAAEMLKDAAAVDVIHVPYGGGAPALVDLIGERVTFMLLDPAQVMTHIRSGKLKALAVGGNQHLPLLPNVPTLAEQGFANVDAAVWWGILVPSKTAPAIVARLNAEFNTALAQPALKARLAELGVIAQPGTPDAFGKHIQEQMSKWTAVVQRAHIALD